jgi:hypothetical protein
VARVGRRAEIDDGLVGRREADVREEVREPLLAARAVGGQLDRS